MGLKPHRRTPFKTTATFLDIPKNQPLHITRSPTTQEHQVSKKASKY